MSSIHSHSKNCNIQLFLLPTVGKAEKSSTDILKKWIKKAAKQTKLQ